MTASLEPDFVVLRADWPGPEYEGLRPAEVAHFAPQGLALAPPMIVRPYGDLPSPDYYGMQGTITHPVKSAPLNDDAGGVVYFSAHIPPDQIVSSLDLFGFRSLAKDYALFVVASDNPPEDNFLDQMRIVSHGALAHFFRADSTGLAPQANDAGAAVVRFLEWQNEKWGHGDGRQALAGLLGGDGDWAKEQLAFGAMIENAYWGIYRVWSRAWLVTK